MDFKTREVEVVVSWFYTIRQDGEEGLENIHKISQGTNDQVE